MFLLLNDANESTGRDIGLRPKRTSLVFIHSLPRLKYLGKMLNLFDLFIQLAVQVELAKQGILLDHFRATPVGIKLMTKA